MNILVVVAAGGGVRLGADVPKALVVLGDRPLVAHAVARLAPLVERVVVTAPVGHADTLREALAPWDVRVVVGGDTRSASVARGVRAAGADDDDVVAIHDAARALTPAPVLAAAMRAVTGDVLAAAPAVPVVDTLKRDTGTAITQVPDRDQLHAVQTPQVARAATWWEAHDGRDATDDIGLVQAAIADGRLTGRVRLTKGSVLATKVTRPVDLLLARAMLAEESTLLDLEGWT